MKTTINPSIWIKCLYCFFIIFHCSTSLFSQDKIITNKGRISFTSNAPLELIKASSDQMKFAIDPASNQIAICVAIQSFGGFNSGLQREHFNEKYMESDKYPTATFIGKIIEKVDFTTDGTYDVRAKGVLEVHGQKQTRIVKGKIIIKNHSISINTDFTIPLADHNIMVPRLVSEKIATEIDVNIAADLVIK